MIKSILPSGRVCVLLNGTIIMVTHYRGYNLVNVWLLSKVQDIHQDMS